MGSKTVIAVLAGVAVTVALLVLEPWKVDEAAVDVAPRAAPGDHVAQVDLLSDPMSGPATRAVLENGATRREAVALATPATEGDLELRVRFASDNAPAAGLRGHLSWEHEPRAGFALDASGTAVLADLRAGRWGLILHGYGFWYADVIAGETTTIELDLEPGIIVRGEVLDPDETPVPGAEVFFSREGDVPGTWTMAVTDGAGRFFLRDIAPWRQEGPYTILAARAPGYTTSHQWTAVSVPGDEVELVLRLTGRGGGVRGRVVTEDGVPVAGVGLRFPEHAPLFHFAVSMEGVNLRGAPALRLVTDAEGEFAAETVPAGTIVIRVESDRHPEKTVTVDVVKGVMESLEIVLEAGGSVEGTVRDGEGNALADVSVSAGVLDRRQWRYHYRSTRTDAQGTYRFEGLLGKVKVTALAASRRNTSREVEVVAGETTWVDLTLVAGKSLAGTLVDETGQPLAEHRVCVIEPGKDGLWQRESRTDQAGRFLLQDLPAGPKALEVRRPQPFSTPPLLIAPWPEDEEDFRLVVPTANLPTAFVSGIVLDDSDASVENVELGLRAKDHNWSKQDFPDRVSQRFRFGPLVPGGYLLSVDAAGHMPVQMEVLDLAVGETRDMGTIRLIAGGVLYVDLRSTDPAIENLEPNARMISAESVEVIRFQVRASVLRSGVVPPASYRLHLSGRRSAHREVPVTIVAGETTRLELELEPGTYRALKFDPVPEDERPTVEVFDPEGRPFAGRVFSHQQGATIFGLTRGEWRVVVRTADGLAGETTFTVDTLNYPTERIPLALR